MNNTVQLGIATVGCVVSLVGLKLVLAAVKFAQTATKVNGRVMSRKAQETATDSDQSTEYRVVEFELNSKKYHIESRLGIVGLGKTGDVVQVLVNTQDPESSVLASWVELYAPGLIFLVSGLGVAVAFLLF